MKNSFIDVTKQPDSILFQYEDSPVRFEEFDGKEEQNDKIDFDNGKITLYPCDRPIKRIKLRRRGDMSAVHMIYGDDIAMISVGASWNAPVPHTPLW